MWMSRHARSMAVLLLGIAACGGAGDAPTFGGAGVPTIEATPEIASLERAMHARLNRDRAKQGLAPLAFDEKLASVGRAHSEDMRTHKFFAHDSPQTGSLEDRLDRAGYLNRLARENLGEGPTVDGTQDALLKSPGHHANIMAKDVTHVGIGIVKGGLAAPANILVTQVFATPIAPMDPAQAGEAVAKSIQQARRGAGLKPLPRHPKLDELAQEHVKELADDLDPSSAAAIGKKVTGALSGSGLRGVVVGAGLFLTPELFEAKGVVLEARARALGIATAPARDERGRPAIKVLMLVGL
jgi:uncharacterized protein YkwD